MCLEILKTYTHMFCRCYSRVGRQTGRQVISVGTGCEHVGVVIHEIG
jgi:hypothetical protein